MTSGSLSLFDRPKPMPPMVLGGKTPRPYQLEAFSGNPRDTRYPGIRACFAKHRSTAVVVFTGGGKTVIASMAALEATGRVLFLAHLDTLVRQAADELSHMTGQPWELEQAGFRAARLGTRNVVGSVQTMMRPGRLHDWAPDAFSLVIVDEAHHYVQAAFKRPLDYFASAKILALTATPKRSDRKALGRYVDSAAYKMDLLDGINEGWSVKLDCRQPIELEVSLDDVRTVTDKNSERYGDFIEADMEEKIKQVIGPVVEACLTKCGDLRTVIFTPRVESAHATAKALNKLRPGCAKAVDGKMPADEKRAILRGHKAGEFQYLANCGIVVEGYDDRALTCMVDAAPTKSHTRCAQKVGRLLRPLANVDFFRTADERKAAIAASTKPQAVWIDLKFNGSKLMGSRIVTPEQLLGGSYTDKEQSKARKILEKRGGDPRAALEEARRQLAHAAGRAKTKLKLKSFDPTKDGQPPEPPPEPVTDGQLRMMEGFKIPATAATTKAAAQKLIAYEWLAKSRGWIDYTRRAFLQKWVGMSGRGMSLGNYRSVIHYWQAAGKPRQMSREQIRSAISGEDLDAKGAARWGL